MLIFVMPIFNCNFRGPFVLDREFHGHFVHDRELCGPFDELREAEGNPRFVSATSSIQVAGP